MAEPIRVSPTLALDPAEIVEEFVRASGPGGQNVNKVSSAVRLRFDAAHSASLPAPVRARLLRLAGKRANRDGVIVIVAQAHRTQAQNRADALARLLDLVREAAVEPKHRRPTRPTKASKRRRLEAKTRRGALKRLRAQYADE
jgi:ribosome-associated protein